MTDPKDGVTPDAPPASSRERVQCSNCCQLAPVTSRGMGLVFYVCELCRTSGAVSGDAVVVLPDDAGS